MPSMPTIYNPMVQGMSTGKYVTVTTDEEAVAANQKVGGTEGIQSTSEAGTCCALEMVKKVLPMEGLTLGDMVQAVSGGWWLVHHSNMIKNDGIVVRANKEKSAHSAGRSPSIGPLTCGPCLDPPRHF